MKKEEKKKNGKLMVKQEDKWKVDHDHVLSDVFFLKVGRYVEFWAI